MKSLKLVLVFIAVSACSAERPGCRVPLSKKDNGFVFSAPSSLADREPFKARIGTTKAWCAQNNIRYREYLQVDMSKFRRIAAVKIQGFKSSFREFYVKSFLLGYSMEGKKWKFYKSQTKSRSPLKFTGNTDTSSSKWNYLHPAFVAKHIRLYPLTFHNGMCLKMELYGCDETLDCTHVVKLDKNQTEIVNIVSPSYPKPYPSGIHCDWLIFLPKQDTTVSLVSMDFDVGSASSNLKSCAKQVVKIYNSLYKFSKHLHGAYCNSTEHNMPVIQNITNKVDVKKSVEALRISFDGINNTLQHRGFKLVLWKSHKDIKTVRACENSTISLDCRGHERQIEVTHVFYGQRQNSDFCVKNRSQPVSSLSKYACKASDVLPKLKKTCDYRNVCKIVVQKKSFPHDCSASDPMEMFVVYQCNATKQFVTYSFPTKAIHSSSESSPASSKPRTSAVVATTPPTPATKFISKTEVDEEITKENVVTKSSDVPHPTGKIIERKEESAFNSSIILIGAVCGAVVLLIVIVVVTILCLRKARKNEKEKVNEKGVVTSDSVHSKVTGESDSLYEKIDDMEREIGNLRYQSEPNKYSPLHDARHGMSENPLYQSGDSNKNSSSYDVPTATKVRYIGTSGSPVILASSVPGQHHLGSLKSPEELPSNSIPMEKYLEPPTDSPIPVGRYSCTVATPMTSSGEDVYEAMDGSQA